MAPLSDRLYTEASDCADEKGFDMEIASTADDCYDVTSVSAANIDDTRWLLDGATPTEKMSDSSAFGNDLATLVDKERLENES